MRLTSKPVLLATIAALAGSTAHAETRDEPQSLALAAVYTADAVGVVQGVHPRAGRYLDNLDLTADLDLDRAVGWRGAVLHAYALNNSGGAPNDVAGTLQGVDNIEVSRPRLRLFELWVEQSFAEGRLSARTGLYNLNSEFYASDAAGLLLNPSFGIGSELAATGPNGPSIFPSTALGLRLNADLGEGRYARAAVLNARSGVLGDPGGVDMKFDRGVLGIVEAGVEGPVRLGVGAWRYSREQEDIRRLAATGAPEPATAQGAYLLAERVFAEPADGPSVAGFIRLGVSDGRTTAFEGGWQAGVRIGHPVASRPQGVLSLGVQQGLLDAPFRANLTDSGVRPARAESAIEITYSDRITDRITVQPDLQWIHRAGGDRDAPNRLVVAVRIKVDLLPLQPDV